MKIKECEIRGIERIEGKKKATGEPFAFWKLHLLIPSSIPKCEGMKSGSCIVADDEFIEEGVTLGALCTVVSTGFDRYEFVMIDA